MSDQSKKIDNKTLRSFGLVVGGIFAFIAVLPMLIHHRSFHLWAAIVAAALILPALAAPVVLTWPYRLWMAIGHGLGWLNTRLILGLIYFVVFTPLGLAMRLFGYDAMARRFDSKAETYRCPVSPRSANHMEKQF